MTYFGWVVILALFVACYASGRSTGRTEVRCKAAHVLRRMVDEGILDCDQAYDASSRIGIEAYDYHWDWGNYVSPGHNGGKDA